MPSSELGQVRGSRRVSARSSNKSHQEQIGWIKEDGLFRSRAGLWTVFLACRRVACLPKSRPISDFSSGRSVKASALRSNSSLGSEFRERKKSYLG